MEQPKDETNHIFYEKLWVDRGGNVGVQCDKCGNTIWGKHSKPKQLDDGTFCETDQALIQSNFCETETARHKNEQEGEVCLHQPSQPN
jgi:hypothetical protein